MLCLVVGLLALGWADGQNPFMTFRGHFIPAPVYNPFSYPYLHEPGLYHPGLQASNPHPQAFLAYLQPTDPEPPVLLTTKDEPVPLPQPKRRPESVVVPRRGSSRYEKADSVVRPSTSRIDKSQLPVAKPTARGDLDEIVTSPEKPQQDDETSPPDDNKESASILSYYNDMTADGGYSYKYETADGIKREESAVMKPIGGPSERSLVPAVRGSYSYPAADGTIVRVSYIADEAGFRTQGAQLPSQPSSIANRFRFRFHQPNRAPIRY